MQTKQFIQAEAEVTTVVALRKGDVYKRLVEKTSYESAKLYFGVVTDVLFNGENAAITVLEFFKNYGDVKVELKVFSTNDDLMIFAATAEELHAEAGDLIVSARREVESRRRDLAKAEDVLAQVEALSVLGVSQALCAPTRPNTLGGKYACSHRVAVQW